MAKVTRKKNEHSQKVLRAFNLSGAFSDGMVGKVGWGEKNKYQAEKGQPEQFVAEIAARNEFGDPPNNQPPRPFMRGAIKSKRNAWRETATNAVKRVMQGNQEFPSGFVLEVVGLEAESDIRQSILDFTSPSLKSSTIKAKESWRKRGHVLFASPDKPLIRSGIMLKTLISVVEKK